MTIPAWSENWVRNYERIGEWSRAVILMTRINEEEYKLYESRKAQDIDALDLQTAIVTFGGNFFYLLDWITNGIQKINSNVSVPNDCKLDTVDLTEYKEIWKKHVSQSFQNALEPIESACCKVLQDTAAKRNP